MLAVGLVFALGGATASASGVTTVAGSAYGYHAFNISFFGGGQPDTGPTPAVALAPNASNSPQSASSTTGLVVYGPATLFTSDAESASSSGSLGATGSVTSSTSVIDINKATTQPGTGSELLTADKITSTCTATTSGASGSTSVTNGTVQVNDTTPPKLVNVPASPKANFTVKGVIHVNGMKEVFKYVFNEQLKSGKSILVNAVDEYFQGPTAKGNLIIGQAICSTAGTNVSAGITHTPNPVPAGGTVTFTITVTNNGPNAAPLVGALSSITGGGKATSAAPSAGTCTTPTLAGASVSCTLGTIASGSSVTIAVAVTAPSTSGGTVGITTALSSPADNNTSNEASDSVSVS